MVLKVKSVFWDILRALTPAPGTNEEKYRKASCRLWGSALLLTK